MSEHLLLQLNFEDGVGELDADSDHPLLAPLRVAIQTGKPVGAWAWCLARDDSNSTVKVIGSLVHTPGNRLLFFPAARAQIAATSDPLTPSGSVLDHLTLDPPDHRGRHRSHIALAGQGALGRRTSNKTSSAPAGHLVPWFTLATPSLATFPVMPLRLNARIKSHRRDPQQFGAALAGRPHIFSIPLPPQRPGSFLQLDVWVGRSQGWTALKAGPLVFNLDRKLISRPRIDDVEVFPYDWALNANLGIRALVSRPLGRLDALVFVRATLQA